MHSLSEDLRAAKALIDTPEKWGKGAWLSDDGRRCAEGACLGATGGHIWSRLFEPLSEALPPEWKQNYNPVVNFNDDPRTTHADIMALFDRAIEAAHNQGTDDAR